MGRVSGSWVMGQWVMGHGSNGSTNLDGSRLSRVTKCDSMSALQGAWSFLDF